MEQKSQQTDQQATNAALAALAAAGNSFALGQLWEINQGFLHRLFWQWYSKNKTTADAHGLTLEDFDQEAFFAVQAAAQAYDPEKGRFLTLLSYYVQNQINKVVCGERGRYISTEDGRQVRISANPLDDCTSFDAPLDAGDDGSGTRGDLIEDPAASQAFQKSEDEIYTEELHTALEEAMAQNLTVREAHILRRRYYDCQSLRAVGNELGVQRETIRQIERRCIRKPESCPSSSAGMMTSSQREHGGGQALMHGSTTAAFKSALWNIWKLKTVNSISPSWKKPPSLPLSIAPPSKR